LQVEMTSGPLQWRWIDGRNRKSTSKGREREWLQNGMRITPFAALSCDNRTESIGSSALSTVLLSAIKAGGGARVKISSLKIRVVGPSKDEERPRPVLKFHPPSPARTRATSGNKKLFLNYAHRALRPEFHSRGRHRLINLHNVHRVRRRRELRSRRGLASVV
jgi:hypothetical protein